MQIKSREARENVTAKIRSPIASLKPTEEVSCYMGAYTCSESVFSKVECRRFRPLSPTQEAYL